MVFFFFFIRLSAAKFFGQCAQISPATLFPLVGAMPWRNYDQSFFLRAFKTIEPQISQLADDSRHNLSASTGGAQGLTLQ
jgi:hypothetical protein